jgi:hypothetical protein
LSAVTKSQGRSISEPKPIDYYAELFAYDEQPETSASIRIDANGSAPF